MEKAKSKPKREMVSTKSFLRQLSLELEYELLDQVDVKRTRELRREVRRAVSREVEERLSRELAEDIEETLERAREAVAPVIKEIREAVEAKGEERWFQRFNLSVRLQHLVMAVSVVLLIPFSYEVAIDLFIAIAPESFLRESPPTITVSSSARLWQTPTCLVRFLTERATPSRASC